MSRITAGGNEPASAICTTQRVIGFGSSNVQPGISPHYLRLVDPSCSLAPIGINFNSVKGSVAVKTTI
jgi:hypothetical protein